MLDEREAEKQVAEACHKQIAEMEDCRTRGLASLRLVALLIAVEEEAEGAVQWLAKSASAQILFLKSWPRFLDPSLTNDSLTELNQAHTGV
jgi:hypothetical protein